MRRLLCVLTLVLLTLTVGHSEPVKTGPPGGPREAAQRFYDQYIKVKDTVRWVAKSRAVSPGLKKAFAASMKDPDTDSDPIVEGQDTPPSGFKASQPVVKGTTATVVMSSSDPGFPQKIRVRLAFDGKAWLIDGVNKLNAK